MIFERTDTGGVVVYVSENGEEFPLDARRVQVRSGEAFVVEWERVWKTVGVGLHAYRAESTVPFLITVSSGIRFRAPIDGVDIISVFGPNGGSLYP